MNRYLLIFLDKTLFQVIFLLSILLERLKRKTKPEYFPKILGNAYFLVIRPGGIGDGLMSIAFLKALRKAFPNGKITLLCVQKNRAAFQQLDLYDDLIVLDKGSDIFKNIRGLLSQKYDVVFDLEPFRKISAVISYFTGALTRIGFDTNLRRLLYTHFTTYANDRCYESLNMIRQLTVFGVNVSENEAADIRFHLPDSSLQRAHEILKSHHLNPQKDAIVAVAPGVLKPHHRWVMSRFSALIERIAADDDVKVVLLGAPADVPDANKVVEYLPREATNVVNLVGKTSISDVLGILTDCKVLIACDGGIVYMAAAMECCTISIWGPGVMERFKPPGENHIGIRKNYFCVPCVNYSRLGEFPKCPYDRRCINDITAQDVFQAYVKLRQKTPEHGAEME